MTCCCCCFCIVETLCISEPRLFCDQTCDCADCLDENPDFCKNLPPKPTPQCGDATFEHPTENCDATSFCRRSVCHSVRTECFASDACCDCYHGTAYNGTACVSVNDQCACVDERGDIHAPGSTWNDYDNPSCIQYTCVNNDIVAINRELDCPMIAGCALNEIGPLKMPGDCCVTCLPMATTVATATTTELAPPQTTQGTTTTAQQPTCVSDPTCFCQEDCAVPTKCVDTVACCESFECPESYERINGACILRTACVEPTSSPTPKCTYPMLSGTDLVQDITASSYFAAEGVEEHRPSEGTKNGNPWMVDPSNDRDRQFTVAFRKPIELTGFSIKLVHVVAFVISTSTDGVDFTPYSEPNEVYVDRNTGKPAKTFQGKDFPGNRFRTTFFRAPLTATHFRVTIKDVDSSPNRDLNFPKLNLEVLGCHEDVPGRHKSRTRRGR